MANSGENYSSSNMPDEGSKLKTNTVISTSVGGDSDISPSVSSTVAGSGTTAQTTNPAYKQKSPTNKKAAIVVPTSPVDVDDYVQQTTTKKKPAIDTPIDVDDYTEGPVDVDLFFMSTDNNLAKLYKDDVSRITYDEDVDDTGKKQKKDTKQNTVINHKYMFASDDDNEEYDNFDEAYQMDNKANLFFYNPQTKALLDKDASLIPGSPFSKPPNRKVGLNRPTEPLSIAKYASTFSFLLTMGWIIVMLLAAFWSYNSAGRIIVEVILALLSFFGLFWNSYFLVSSVLKCFIPSEAFTTNTKYCSIIPETKPANTEWLDVTIQIPVYKESLQEVMMPTLKSCIMARDYYYLHTHGARCNIVICDDGMMSYLHDNFPAAEMLWQQINKTRGRILRLSLLLQQVPRASRRHLKGLRSKHVYEVFHRMLFYYHYNIGFVARSTVDRRGKFKKASNLNSHLRLALGAAQFLDKEIHSGLSFEDALLKEAHNDDGSRYIMFGNDIKLGHLICINDADARMAESVIFKTVPEFLNDPTLGFTQHATKTMNEQRGESFYTNMLTVYTDALYQGHFLLSSILGCHPPLVGHSIFLRTEALNQVGRMRTLRKAADWLNNIGLQFLPVDQIGFGNLQAQNRIEYWSESHVSEDFELMIHLYNLGFNGRYCAYPDCEFQEGITRNFDEEAGRHRKFALGAHELVFNSFPDMIGRGIFTPLFRTFLKCDIPSYYKIFLTAYLCSYASGGTYIIVFGAAAFTRLIDEEDSIGTLKAISPAGIIILNFVIYYLIGYITFITSILRMNSANNKLLFPEYRKQCCSAIYITYVMLRFCFIFQFLFYNVACFTFYFLGSMDHMLARPGIVGATNKDSINISRCRAFCDMARFNSGSWAIAIVIGGLGYATVLQEYDWDPSIIPSKDELVDHILFSGPPVFLALLAFVVPILLNPWILGWPFYRPNAVKKLPATNGKIPPSANDATNFNYLQKSKPTPLELDKAIQKASNKADVELGSLRTIGVVSSPVKGTARTK